MHRVLNWWLSLPADRRARAARGALELLGLGLLTAGSACVYWPLGLLVPGALLTAAAVYGSRK